MMTDRTSRSATPLALALCLVASVATAADPTAASGAAPAPSAPAREAARPDDPSFNLGLVLGNQLEHSGLAGKVKLDALVRGMRRGLAGAPVSPEQRAQATQFMRGARDTLADQNRAAAKDFLARNKSTAGVQATATGLQYRVISDGDATRATPRTTDQVTVRYRASLLDGRTFDSSDAHAEAATFRMTSILKGWQEALPKMHPGANWQLWVPPELAYDAHPPPGIPPGALIIYELELIKVVAPPVDPQLLRKGTGAGKPPPAAKPAAPPR
jgi:FKBP-type peptidyl-prolyl cis-trans isomerase